VLQLPFIVLLKQYRANQPNDGGFIGEDADDIGAPLDLLVEPARAGWWASVSMCRPKGGGQ
jgi:hypothetical protein